MSNKNIIQLQFITQDHPDRSHIEQTQLAIEGGCQWVQLRIKDRSVEEITVVAKEMKQLCEQHNVQLIINDNPELAKAIGAHGVHLGKNDMSPSEARTLLGEEIIIGGTANTIEDIEYLHKQGVDYIGCGPFRFTTTKKNLSPIVGEDGYREIVKQMAERNINLPIVGIGGITLEDLPTLKSTGLTGIAISGLIANADSPTEATKQLLSAWNIQST